MIAAAEIMPDMPFTAAIFSRLARARRAITRYATLLLISFFSSYVTPRGYERCRLLAFSSYQLIERTFLSFFKFYTTNTQAACAAAALSWYGIVLSSYLAVYRRAQYRDIGASFMTYLMSTIASSREYAPRAMLTKRCFDAKV